MRRPPGRPVWHLVTVLPHVGELARRPPQPSCYRTPADGVPVATSVVIPHYNDLTHLCHTLDALEADLQARDDVEIIVADNGSSLAELELREAIGERAVLVVEPRSGAGLARNAGVARARGEVLAFVDSDCLPLPGWLAAGERALHHHDVVGGRVDVHLEHDGRPTAADAFEAVFAFDNRAYIQRKGFTGSGNLFCRHAVFDAVGGFRATVSEDVDWSRRARAAGFTLGYCDDAVVSHPTRSDWPALLAKWRRITREGYALRRSNGGGAAGWLARTALLPLSIVAHAPRIWRSPRLTGRRERLQALGALARLRLWRMGDAVKVVAEDRARR